MSHEISTTPLVHHALSSTPKKTVYIPHLYRTPPNPSPPVPTPPAPPARLMTMLALTGLEDFQSLEPDAWGIPGFPKDVAGRRDCFEAEEGEGLEVMAVPGVAFDADFNRLGHGRGFYDLFLSRYCGRRRKPVL